MSWSGGNELFHEIFPIVRRAFPDVKEQVVYLSNFIYSLTEFDMDYEDLMRFDPDVDFILSKIEARDSLFNKYLSAARATLQEKHNTQVVNNFIHKIQAKIDAKEISNSEINSVGKNSAVLEVINICSVYINDEESFAEFASLVLTGFHVLDENIISLENDSDLLNGISAQIESEKDEWTKRLNTLLKKEKNLPALEQEIKKLEAKIKRALTTAEKKSEKQALADANAVTYGVTEKEVRKPTKSSVSKKNDKKKGGKKTVNSKPSALNCDVSATTIEKISRKTELSNAEITTVLDAIAELAGEELRLLGRTTLLNLLIVKTTVRPATEEHEGINPFTQEKMLFSAKPERVRVKALPTRQLKDFAESFLD